MAPGKGEVHEPGELAGRVVVPPAKGASHMLREAISKVAWQVEKALSLLASKLPVIVSFLGVSHAEKELPGGSLVCRGGPAPGW